MYGFSYKNINITLVLKGPGAKSCVLCATWAQKCQYSLGLEGPRCQKLCTVCGLGATILTSFRFWKVQVPKVQRCVRLGGKTINIPFCYSFSVFLPQLSTSILLFVNFSAFQNDQKATHFFICFYPVSIFLPQ